MESPINNLKLNQAIIILLMFFVGCSQNENIEPSINDSILLLESISQDGVLINKYSYTENGQIEEIKKFNGENVPNGGIRYIYIGDSITEITYNSLNDTIKFGYIYPLGMGSFRMDYYSKISNLLEYHIIELTTDGCSNPNTTIYNSDNDIERVVWPPINRTI
jgi:hypothetical protein